MASLQIVGGVNAGKSFELREVECTIGRELWCQVRLNSRTVSRMHACISQQADGYFIEDLDSVNGTAVNGRRIDRPTRLNDGDRIQIFDINLLFQIKVSVGGPVVPPDLEQQSQHAPLPENKLVGQTDLNVQSNEKSMTGSEKKLEAILRIAHSLGTTLAVDEILCRILDVLFDLFPHAQTGYILQAAAGGDLSVTELKSRGDSSDTLNAISLKNARRVMADGLALLTDTAKRDTRASELADSIFDDEVRSIMCAPLIGPSRTAMGVIELVSVERDKPFLPGDLEVLSTMAILAGQAVEYARLHESLLKLEGRRRESAMAKSVQLHFLPQALPPISGYTFFHHYAAAESIAGDYFDYIPVPDGRWGIAIGDVAGKGFSAALMMARLCSDVRFCLLTCPSPAEAVHKLNQQVCGQAQGDFFVTLVLFLLDPKAHELTIVNAGHPLPLLRKTGARCSNAVSLEYTSLPLGVEPNASYMQSTLRLEPGDLVLAYTDGVSESINPQGKLFGVNLIKETINNTKPVPTYAGRALLAGVREFAQGHPQSDDICIVSFGRNLRSTRLA